MRPTTSSDLNKKGCSSIISASCVLWHGPDLDCIETCKGDSMVDVIDKISTEVCALKETLTFTSLQLDCLDDSCTGCSLCSDEDKILKNILECIIKKYCALKTQVDAIPLTPSDGEADCPATFNIDANCLESLAGRSLPTSPTNDQILQLIADAVCISYDDLLARIDQLNIDLIACCNSGGGGSGTIPQVNSSCLFVGLKDIDEAYILLDGEFCDLKTLMGDFGDLADSFNPSAPCSATINGYLGTTIGGAFTLDASLTNIYDVLCALVEKVETLEAVQETCCVFSCDDIVIEVIGSVSDPDLELVTLVFTFNGSIAFPPSYTVVDMGSTVRFTDKNGTVSPLLSIDILDDLTYTDMDLSYLDLSGDLTMTLDIKYQITDALGVVHTCYKCLAGVIKINNDCAVCTLTVAGGTTVSLKVTYTYDGNTNVIIISSNGEFFIPRGAIITSIVDESVVSPSLSSDCTTLTIPDPLELNCWRFSIPEQLFENGITSDSENDAGDFFIRAVIVGGVRYSVAATPAHFGVKSNDDNACDNALCGGTGVMTATEAFTSLTGYSSGGVTYYTNTTLTSYINALNTSISPTNPVLKTFTSVCTNACSVCMTYRFLHLQSYGTDVPYLEMDVVSGPITTIIQIQAEANSSVECKCEGE